MTAIAQAVKQLSKDAKNDAVKTITATVKSVDWDKRTCKCEDENGVEYFKVRLRAVLNDSKNGMCMKPKVNSLVMIAPVNNSSRTRYVCMFTEVEAIELLGDSDVEVIYNSGNNAGMCKVKEVVKKVNVLEDDLNSLKTVFKSWVVTPQDGGAALFSGATAWAAQTITKTVQSDLENTKVKH